MKNKYEKKNIVPILIFIFILTCVFVTFLSFSKYRTQLDSTEDKGTSAKFKVSSNNIEEINLFSTRVDNPDVKEGTIAPGTEGVITISVENDSEISTTYKIILTETNENEIPIEYSIDGKNYVKAEDFENEFEKTENFVLGYTGSEIPTKATVDIYWRWALNGDESSTQQNQTAYTDTIIGHNLSENREIKLKIEAEFTQKN